jgi:hypothetical protein
VYPPSQPDISSMVSVADPGGVIVLRDGWFGAPIDVLIHADLSAVCLQDGNIFWL